MERILISACLTGAPVRYDGRPKDAGIALIGAWAAEGRLVPLCPELAGGFGVPRRPAEIAPGFDGAEVLVGQARILDSAGIEGAQGWVGCFADSDDVVLGSDIPAK